MDAEGMIALSSLGTVVSLVGQLVLAAGLFATLMPLWIAWLLYERWPGLEAGALLAFSFGGAYSAATYFAGAMLPLKVIYGNPQLAELIHRSRLVVFDGLLLPPLAWLLLELARHGARDDPLAEAARRWLGDERWRLRLAVAVGFLQFLLAKSAVIDAVKYPMSTDNFLGVLFWRPTRCTRAMQRPWLLATRGLLAMGAWRLFWLRCPWILLAAAALRLAYHGHLAQGGLWPWTAFLQPFATAAVASAYLDAMNLVYKE